MESNADDAVALLTGEAWRLVIFLKWIERADRLYRKRNSSADLHMIISDDFIKVWSMVLGSAEILRLLCVVKAN